MTASATKRRTQKERRSESDARIIEAAIELFATQGYRRTTLIQIGHAAGYTGTLISNRFGSKDRLLRAVLAHILNRFSLSSPDADISKVAESGATPISAETLLSNFIELYLQDVDDKQSRIRALHVIIGEALGAFPQVHDQIVKVNRAFRNRIEEYVVYGIETGSFRRDLDPAEAAILIVGLLRGVTMQSLAEPRKIAIKPMIKPVQAAILSIVT